jgi:hypothetical protein
VTAPADFCALILTHGRPDRVITLNALNMAGSTVPWFLVVDDEDPTLGAYLDKYGPDRVRVFSKEEIAATFDEGDNFRDRRCIVYARNASFGIAERLGYRWFVQLDDDYTTFRYRFDADRRWKSWAPIQNMDAVWSALLEFYKNCPAFATIAIGQGGDYLGGAASSTTKTIRTFRKAMNSFICDTHRPFQFPGRLNEDVNAYTELQRAGLVFLTILQVWLDQLATQTNAGGMTDVYLESGTYVKSFYSVMRCPSAVSIQPIRERNLRIHHGVHWNAAAPKILNPTHRKPRVDA